MCYGERLVTRLATRRRHPGGFLLATGSFPRPQRCELTYLERLRMWTGSCSFLNSRAVSRNGVYLYEKNSFRINFATAMVPFVRAQVGGTGAAGYGHVGAPGVQSGVAGQPQTQSGASNPYGTKSTMSKPGQTPILNGNRYGFNRGVGGTTFNGINGNGLGGTNYGGANGTNNNGQNSGNHGRNSVGR
jgi:hypothetical protein